MLRDAGADAAIADRVHALTMATRHGKSPSTPDTKLLLARPALFSMQACADRLDAKARANLARAIASLG